MAVSAETVRRMDTLFLSFLPPSYVIMDPPHFIHPAIRSLLLRSSGGDTPETIEVYSLEEDKSSSSSRSSKRQSTGEGAEPPLLATFNMKQILESRLAQAKDYPSQRRSSKTNEMPQDPNLVFVVKLGTLQVISSPFRGSSNLS